jgi:hypothetical protein
VIAEEVSAEVCSKRVAWPVIVSRSFKEWARFCKPGSGRSTEIIPMAHNFKVGDHVEWNSEAGRVRGTIKKKVTSEIEFKGYTVHASKEEPQYLIESDKTDHLAMHKGSALKKVGKVKR